MGTLASRQRDCAVFRPEHDRERSDDDGRHLQVRAEPQGELTEQIAVALGVALSAPAAVPR